MRDWCWATDKERSKSATRNCGHRTGRPNLWVQVTNRRLVVARHPQFAKRGGPVAPKSECQLRAARHYSNSHVQNHARHRQLPGSSCQQNGSDVSRAGPGQPRIAMLQLARRVFTGCSSTLNFRTGREDRAGPKICQIKEGNGENRTMRKCACVESATRNPLCWHSNLASCSLGEKIQPRASSRGNTVISARLGGVISACSPAGEAASQFSCPALFRRLVRYFALFLASTGRNPFRQ